MWCDKCQADVVPILASDSQLPGCPVCQSHLAVPEMGGSSAEAATTGAERKTLSDPRELLARWAREDALGALDDESSAARDAGIEARAQVRFDVAHPLIPPQSAFTGHTPAANPYSTPTPAAALPELPPQDLVIHPPHAFSPPHFYTPAPPTALPDKSSRWVTLVGQIFAYIGVGGLTVGTVLVLMGYFGGPANYATTGWLITTAGQMLLFLGVITLVSGGMEQTTQEVVSRIDTLHARLGSIETAAWGGRTSGSDDRQERVTPQA